MLNNWNTKGYSELLVKCNTCFECKAERGRNWTYKIFLESLNYKEKSFITLTYRDLKNGTQQLEKKHLQNFIKRLRKKIHPKKIKYFASGEYGEKRGRPHYHIIILGYQPKDLKPLKGKRKSTKGYNMYDSEEIKKLWGYGRISVQRFNYKEIGYLSLYLNQNEKINHKHNKEIIQRRKKAINEIKVQLGISIKAQKKTQTKDTPNYIQIKTIKELNKEELYQYKKMYNKELAKAKYKYIIEPEFNLWSNGMGFNTWINKKYYKYDLIIDNKTFEIPKEYLRKVLDNPKYRNNKELLEYTIYHSLERRKEAEKQFKELTKDNPEIDITDNKEAITIWKEEDQTKENKNFNNIKLKKILLTDF